MLEPAEPQIAEESIKANAGCRTESGKILTLKLSRKSSIIKEKQHVPKAACKEPNTQTRDTLDTHGPLNPTRPSLGGRLISGADAQ